MLKIMMTFIFVAFLMLSSVSASSWTQYGGTSTRSNFLDGEGELNYLNARYFSEDDSFSETDTQVVIGDVTGDIYPEILAVSLKNNELQIYDNKMSLLWKYEEDADWIGVDNPSYKIASLSLANLDSDNKNEIVFSLCSVDSKESRIHIFDGNGSELSVIEVEGRVNAGNVVIDDFDGDGANEILVGAQDIHIFYPNGEEKYTFEPFSKEKHGVSEIVYRRGFFSALIWHYNHTLYQYNDTFRPYHSYMNLSYFAINKDFSLQLVQFRELESSDSSTSDFYRGMFSDNEMETLFLTRNKGFDAIDIEKNFIKYSVKWMATPTHAVILGENTSAWVKSTLIMVCKNGKTNNYSVDRNLGPAVSFGANGDGDKDIIVSEDDGRMLFLDVKSGNIIEKRVEGIISSGTFCSMVHSDIDLDGYEELIVVENNGFSEPGRIVIIDSGSPPGSEESGMTSEILAFVGSVGLVVAAIWIWRKRRNEK